jgi:hypothetical protein
MLNRLAYSGTGNCEHTNFAVHNTATIWKCLGLCTYIVECCSDLCWSNEVRLWAEFACLKVQWRAVTTGLLMNLVPFFMSCVRPLSQDALAYVTSALTFRHNVGSVLIQLQFSCLVCQRPVIPPSFR